MAISGSDGSIILDVTIDEKGLTKGINSIKNAFDKVKTYLGKVGTQIGTGFQKVGNSIKNTFQKLGTYLKGLAGQILGLLSLRAFINFSREAGQMATQQEANVQRLIDIYGEASQAVGDYIDANARALGMSRSAAAQFSAVYGNLFSVWADQKTNAELTAQYLNMTAVVASKSGRTVEDVQERVRSGLLGNTEAIEDLGIFVNVKTIEMTDAFKRMADGRSWEQLGAYEQQQVRTMAILEQATQKYGRTVANTTALARAQYKAAYEDMQATWGQFVNVVLMPVLKVATQIMNIITAGLRAIAGITGKTIESTAGISSSIGGAVDNQEALTDAVKGTNKELKKSLAGFDDIQILSSNATGGGDTGTGAVGGGVADLGLTGGGGTGGQEEGVSTMLATIMSYVGFGMVAIGLILLFNGHIGWGIGFIIAGAAIVSVSEAALSDMQFDFSAQLSTIIGGVGLLIAAIGLILLLKTMSPIAHSIGIGMIIAGAGIFTITAVQTIANNMSEDIKNMLHGIITAISGLELAIGLILLFSGQISPLSIGLVVAGAVGLVSELALYTEAVKEGLQGWVGAIVAIAAGFALVIGLIMLFTGHITPLSIGLIVSGAVGLVAELALNWDYVAEQVTNFFQKNAGLVVGISLALLLLGIILCCVGVITPLSIGLIVAGGAILATEVALNWNYITQSITDFIKNNSGLIVGVSLALIVLGIILLFTGVGTPLAIGLIVAGGGALATTAALNWNFIVDKIKGVWDKVKEFWNTHIAPIFTAEWWENLGKKIMNGLIAGFEAGINGIIGMFEKMINWIVDGLNKISFDVPEWVPGIGGKTFGFNIPEVKFGRVSIPRLAQGAVIPPNREFLAVLGDQKHGTNIEAPLQTIVDAFNIALQGNANYGGGNTEVVLQIDGREFGRAVIEQGRRENRRIGTRLVTI